MKTNKTYRRALKFQRRLGIAFVTLSILMSIAFKANIDIIALSMLFAPLGAYLVCTKKIWVHR